MAAFPLEYQIFELSRPLAHRGIGPIHMRQRRCKAAIFTLCSLCFIGLCFDDFAAADAGSADAKALSCTFHLGANRAQVDVPAPPRDVVGVADGISKLRAFPADITNLCHGYSR